MTDRTSIIIVVFDGLQPTQITPQLMPNLTRFSSEGVEFRNHHPTYPTVTRANVSSVVTGCSPGAHGLSANTFMVRDFDPNRVIGALEPNLQAMADAGLPVLMAPALADILGQQGREYIAIGTGTTGNAYLHNPNAAQSGGATIHPNFTLPRHLHAQLAERFGEWPNPDLPNTPMLSHARRIFTEYILPERDPAVALLWSSEPDKCQHEYGVGLGPVSQALAEADAEFGNLLEYLDKSNRAQSTDVFVLSDHGYSTISETVPVEGMLRDAGFPEITEEGGVVVANNGGSALFYVRDADAHAASSLARWLTSQPWCGAVTAASRLGAIPGTLPASLIGCDGPRAPDLAMSFRWNSEPNAAGYPGHCPSTGGRVGQGQHGSMSRHELHNVGLARGPSFRNGSVVETPTGNVDVAPTVLHLLGIESGIGSMEGRVWREALSTGAAAPPEPAVTLHRAERGDYQQEIQISAVGTARYVDWGNRV